MKKKVWELTVLDNPNRAIGGENDQFYTTDTEAFLIFNLADENFSPTEAMLTLVNSADRSVISETVPVVGGTIEWEMREEIIEHAGNWQAQLVYMQVKNGVDEKYTSPVISFSVTGHLLDQRTPALVAVENWTKFVNDAEELFAEWVALEETLESNENERIANEQTRQENYNELVETGIMQENINQKLVEAEQEYAPRLTELEQNDADLTAQLAQTVEKIEHIDFVRYGKQDINKWFPDFPVQLDFDIYRTRDGSVNHTFNFDKFIKDVPKVYVKALGTGLGDGLTKENPVLTIKKALEVAENLPGDRVNIVLLDKLAPMYLFTTGVTPSGSVFVHNLNKDITLTSDHENGTYIYNGNRTDKLTWSHHGGSVYQTNRTQARDVIDWQNRDGDGLPHLLNKVNTLNECEQTANTWYTESGVVYVHLIDSSEPVQDEIAISIELDQSFYFNAPNREIYYENVSFWTSMLENRSALQVLGNMNTKVIVNSCSTALAKANGFALINVGKSYLFNCTAFRNHDDGFNYHGVIGDGNTEFAFEYNCYAHHNGVDGKTSSNATTGHDEMALLRVGTIGHDCYGPLLADVNSTYSVNIDCTMHDSLNKSSAFYVNDRSSEKVAKLVLINCSGGGVNTKPIHTVGEHEIKMKNFIGHDISDDLNIERLP